MYSTHGTFSRSTSIGSHRPRSRSRSHSAQPPFPLVKLTNASNGSKNPAPKSIALRGNSRCAGGGWGGMQVQYGGGGEGGYVVGVWCWGWGYMWMGMGWGWMGWDGDGWDGDGWNGDAEETKSKLQTPRSKPPPSSPEFPQASKYIHQISNARKTTSAHFTLYFVPVALVQRQRQREVPLRKYAPAKKSTHSNKSHAPNQSYTNNDYDFSRKPSVLNIAFMSTWG